jgi:hypothetical protein
MFAGMGLIAASRKRSLPAATPPAAAAGIAGAASQAGPVVATAASAGFLGALLGPIIGLAGAFFGAKASIERTRSPRERQFMVRMTRCVAAGVVVFCGAMFGLVALGQSLHPVWFGVVVAAVSVIYLLALTAFILRRNRRQRQIQAENSASDYRATMTKDATLADDVWFADCTQAQTFRVLDVPDPGFEDCTVLYRAKLKTEGLTGKAYLEMWCRLPGRGEFFSKGLNQVVTGTNDWASFEIPFFLQKGQKPDLIRLNLVVASTGWLWRKAVTGRVWIKGVEMLKAPLPAST